MYEVPRSSFSSFNMDETLNTTIPYDFDMLNSPLKFFDKNDIINTNINKNDFDLLVEIGKGGQGSVWTARFTPTDKIYALKLVRIIPGKEITFKYVEREIQALKDISFPTCNSFLSCYYNSFYDYDSSSYVIVMEYIEGPTLYKYSNDLRSNDTEKLYRHLLLIIKDLVTALIYINNRDLIHNDIKPTNIIIDLEYVPKLIDFGVVCQAKSCLVDLSDKTAQCCEDFTGTPEFMPPELLSSKKRFFVSDMWSLGISLYLSATGAFPFPFPYPSAYRNASIFGMILERDPEQLNTTNGTLNDIVNKMLIKNPFKRIRAQEVQDLLANL